MNCERPASRHRTAAHEPVERARPDPPPRVVAVFRRADDAVCHSRCGRPLGFQGVRGLIEADFYCYACLTHVTIPVAVLEAMPVTAGVALATTGSPR
jgi:hypothetical protein